MTQKQEKAKRFLDLELMGPVLNQWKWTQRKGNAKENRTKN